MSSMATDEPFTKLAEEGSPHLKCPACGNVYREPVINMCGHTFCRRCADTITTCPVDGAGCAKEQLVVNRLVVGQVDDLKIHCRYGVLQKNGELTLDPNGCPDIIVYGKRKEHEDSCAYGLLPCPYSKSCGSFHRSALDKHQSLCRYAPNINGTNIHNGNCCCEEKHEEIVQLKNTVAKLEKSNATLQTQIQSLSQKVEGLEHFKMDSTSRLEKCASTIASLQQQYEHLVSQMSQISSSNQPLRRSAYSSSSCLAELPTASSRNSASYSNNPSSPGATEKWEMPFQFKCIGTLRGHQDVVWCLTANRGRLYSAGNDKVIKVWNVDQLAKGCIDNYRGHTERIHAMVKKGNRLFTGGADASVRCWDTETGTQTAIVEGAHDNIICAMVIAGEYLFTSSFSLIKVWDLKSLAYINSFSGLHHWVRALAVSPDKVKLYSGSHNVINVWATSGAFQPLGKIDHECGSVHSLAVTKMFIIAGNSGTYNRNIQVFSATTHQFVTTLSSHIGSVVALAVSLSGRYLFSASQDTNIFVWNLENFLPIQNLSRHQDGVTALAICGNLVLSGSEDHEIKVFRYFSLQ